MGRFLYIAHFRSAVRLPLFALLATLFIGVAYTSSDFLIAPARAWGDVLVLGAQWCAIVFGAFPLFYLFALSRRVFSITYPLFCLLSALLAYFRYTTGSVLTTMLLDAALGSGARVALDFVSWQLVLWLLLALLTSLWWVRRRWRLPRQSRLHHTLGALAAVGVVSQISALHRPMFERIPMNLIAVPLSYYEHRRAHLASRAELPGGAMYTGQGDRPLVVLVFGESLRADHLGLNGYSRQTTPRLEREQVVSLPNIYSEYTYTNPSIAHMLTRADEHHPERAESEPSFVPLFARSGYKTAWLANQEPTSSYTYFMGECDTVVYANIDKSYHVFDRWTDSVLLDAFDAELARGRQGAGHLIILHTMGSHWYYNARYTPEYEHYRPTTKSRIVRANTPEEMINAYDNTVLFTDDWLSRLIARLKDREAILIYQSDHGEGLGDDGVWLHASESEAAHRPAALVWMSSAYREKYPHLYERLLAGRDKPRRTDHLFHTMLEAGRIATPVFEAGQSLFYSE